MKAWGNFGRYEIRKKVLEIWHRAGYDSEADDQRGRRDISIREREKGKADAKGSI